MSTTYIHINGPSATHLPFKEGDTVRMVRPYRFCGETYFTTQPLNVLAAFDWPFFGSAMYCVDLPQSDGREFTWIPIKFFAAAEKQP